MTIPSKDVRTDPPTEGASGASGTDAGAHALELEELAYALSHDLSAPLRAILGFAQLLDEECGDELSGDARLFVTNMTDGARRLGNQLRALVTYLRLPPVEAPEAVPLTRILTAVEGQLADALEGAHVTIAPLPVVAGDASQLRLLFLHLFDNALKFRGDGPARITVDVEEVDERAIISVMDQGIGFEPRLASRAIGLFRQLHPSGAYDGVGMGLAICRSVVANHGGELMVETAPGKGARFAFALPLAKRRAAT